MATIRDVAKEADVSLATVSRVINNSFTVTQDKRERVITAMNKLGYQPTIKNKDSKGTNFKTILVISSIYVEDLFNGLQTTSEELDYNVIFCLIGDTLSGIDRANKVLRSLKNETIAGIILCNAVFKDPAFAELLSRFPVVQIGEPIDLSENYVVSIDDFQAAYDMTSHLIKTGKRRIALMSIKQKNSKMTFVAQRENGYIKALEDHRLKFDANLISYSDFTMDGGSFATKEILSLSKLPDAILCVTDWMAIGCISALNRAGISIPRDIAVAGFDNTEMSEFTNPPLTSIDQAFSDIGGEAVRALDCVINNKYTKGRKILVQHELIIRSSTSL